MSLPARIGTCRSAIALVRVKRGSTWITLAVVAPPRPNEVPKLGTVEECHILA